MQGEHELIGEHGRARLVVMGVEVGGRWSEKTSEFLRCLAAAKQSTLIERPSACRLAPRLFPPGWISSLNS